MVQFDAEQVPGSFRGKSNDVARVCYADRVPGLLPGSDCQRYRDVEGGVLGSEKRTFRNMKRSSCKAPGRQKICETRGAETLL